MKTERKQQQIRFDVATSDYIKKQKYHTVGTVTKFNITIVRRDKIDTPSTQIHDRSLSWLGMDRYS